jgi:ABC-type lipoprotein release transport system permease subunit
MTRGAIAAMAVGAAAGLASALALGRLAAAFLYGVEPTDVVSFAAATAVLGLAAGAASFLPAWRAAGVNPAEILRSE